MSRTEPLWYEDYGPDLDVRTLARTVTETDLVSFVALSGMYESLFMDREYLAAQSMYAGRLVPGALVYAISEGLVIQTGLIHDRGLAFLGVDLKIGHPVYVNDTIRVQVRFAEKRETKKPDQGIVITEHRVLNQREEQVQLARITRMIRRR